MTNEINEMNLMEFEQEVKNEENAYNVKLDILSSEYGLPTSEIEIMLLTGEIEF